MCWQGKKIDLTTVALNIALWTTVYITVFYSLKVVNHRPSSKKRLLDWCHFVIGIAVNGTPRPLKNAPLILLRRSLKDFPFSSFANMAPLIPLLYPMCPGLYPNLTRVRVQVFDTGTCPSVWVGYSMKSFQWFWPKMKCPSVLVHVLVSLSMS